MQNSKEKGPNGQTSLHNEVKWASNPLFITFFEYVTRILIFPIYVALLDTFDII